MSKGNRREKIAIKHISFKISPQLKRVIDKDIKRRQKNGEGLNQTDWLQEAIIKKIEEEVPTDIKSDIYALPKEWWEDIKNPNLDQEHHISNQEALSQLKAEEAKLDSIFDKDYTARDFEGIFGINANLLSSYSEFGLLTLGYQPLLRLNKARRLVYIMDNLLKQYDEKEVRILPVVPVYRTHPIDLLIVFSSFIIITSVRYKTRSERKIIYDDSNYALQVKHQSRGIYRWLPCPLVEFDKYEQCLKDQSQRLGLSLKQLNNLPIIKILLLSPPSELHQDNRPYYMTFTDNSLPNPISVSPLCVSERNNIFILYRHDFLNFIKLCQQGVVVRINNTTSNKDDLIRKNNNESSQLSLF